MLYLLEFLEVHSWVQWGGDIPHGMCEVGVTQRLDKIICLLFAQTLESVRHLLHLVESCELIRQFLHVLATPPAKGLQHQPKPNRHCGKMHL